MDGADVKWTFEHEKLKATVGLWVLNDNNLAAQLKYINTLRAAIGNTIQVKFFGVPYTVRFFDDRCGTSFTAHIRRGELAEFLTSVENKQRIVSAVSYDPTAFDSPFSERLYNLCGLQHRSRKSMLLHVATLTACTALQRCNSASAADLLGVSVAHYLDPRQTT